MKKFWIKYKEILLYLIFGGLTTFVSIGSFWLFNKVGFHELISNVLSWVVAVLFAFITNKIWVFNSKTFTSRTFIMQLLIFVSGRIFTLLVETGLIAIFVTWLQFPEMIIKIILQVVVIIINYFISKFVAFRQNKQKIEKCLQVDAIVDKEMEKDG